jgi:hypothetical protein
VRSKSTECEYEAVFTGPDSGVVPELVRQHFVEVHPHKGGSVSRRGTEVHREGSHLQSLLGRSSCSIQTNSGSITNARGSK